MNLDPLLKKDEDLQIIEHGEYSAVVESRLFEEEQTRPDEPAGGEEVYLAVPTRIIRHVFMLHVAIVFFYAIFGMVPAHLLPHQASWALLITSLVTSTILIIVLLYRIHVVVFCMLLLSNFAILTSLAGVLRSMAPFQACSLIFVEYIAGFVFCLFMDKTIDPLGAALVMMVSGLGVWALGLYSFIQEQDWITSVVLFFGGVLFAPLYWALEIRMINRYSLKEEDLLQACVNFYLDPIQWTFAACAKKNPEPPSVPVDEKSTAQLLAEMEACI